MMESTTSWREHRHNIPDGEIAWFEAGEGHPVILINGGPGDDHRYLRPLAESLIPCGLRCILYDQRGTGASHLRHITTQTVHIDRLCEDINALRLDIGLERISLVGHSWGVTLALEYGTRYPEHLERVALLAPGPLREELDPICDANLRHCLSDEERVAFDDLRARRRSAIASNNLDAHREIHLELMDRFIANRWIYDPQVAERFRADYRVNYTYQPLINQLVISSVDREVLWQRLPRITSRALILYGYQDFEPITQAFELQQLLPQLQLVFLNACGHLPWLDQPEATAALLSVFLLGQ